MNNKISGWKFILKNDGRGFNFIDLADKSKSGGKSARKAKRKRYRMIKRRNRNIIKNKIMKLINE